MIVEINFEQDGFVIVPEDISFIRTRKDIKSYNSTRKPTTSYKIIITFKNGKELDFEWLNEERYYDIMHKLKSAMGGE